MTEYFKLNQHNFEMSRKFNNGQFVVHELGGFLRLRTLAKNFCTFTFILLSLATLSLLPVKNGNSDTPRFKTRAVLNQRWKAINSDLSKFDKDGNGSPRKSFPGWKNKLCDGRAQWHQPPSQCLLKSSHIQARLCQSNI